jgi:membrane protease YdiL (CAAX protease family)
MVLEERNLRNFLATLGCVWGSATAFAMVHWPDIWLMAGTGMMGVPWAVEYLLHRNVLPLGLQLGNSHGSVDLEGVFSP